MNLLKKLGNSFYIPTVLKSILHRIDLLELGGGVKTITGEYIDNTDPLNPVLKLGYKTYTALLTQVGTNAPTAIVRKNTLGNITFAYNGVGSFRIISSGLFIKEKTDIIFGNVVNNASGQSLVTTVQGEDRTTSLMPFVTKVDNALSNNALLLTSVTIIVWD